MPCPYFYPVERIEDWGRPARLPLGDAYQGTCRADPLASCAPDPHTTRELCNFGYARGRCPRFPAETGPDAVRFSVAEHSAGTIRVRYAVEENHQPYAQGRLEYSLERSAVLDPQAGDLLRRQAEAYVSTYLRRAAAR